MHIVELHHKVESIVKDKTRGNFPADWDEDFITRDILKAFRSKLGHSFSVEGLKSPLHINWAPYKLTGSNETKFGDIGIVVQVNYRDGDSITGAAFIEAKKRDNGKTSFSAMKTDQLERISENTNHGQVLFYDYEDITEFAGNKDPSTSLGLLDIFLKHSSPRKTLCTSAVISPIENVLSVGKKDTSLYKFGIPFADQLCYRYLQSFDLDHSMSSVNRAVGYAETEGYPKYLISFNVVQGSAERRDQDNIKKFHKPNSNIFSDLS